MWGVRPGYGTGLIVRKPVLALRSGHEPAESLEVPIALGPVRAAGMQVDPAVVALPDLDERVSDRFAPGVEDAAPEPRDGPDGGRDAVVDDEQVVVGVEGQLVRIERSLRLQGRAHELIGEDAAGSERHRAEREPPDQPSAIEREHVVDRSTGRGPLVTGHELLLVAWG